MCGLAGWFGDCKVSHHQRLARARAVESLLVLNADRGTDASGVGAVLPSGRRDIFKKAVSSHALVRHKDLSDLLRSKDAIGMLAHTRLGTMGQNVHENAHPFVERDIMGIHNGMITNYQDLTLKDDKHKPIRVDSQAVFRVLARVKPSPAAYADMLELVQGSLALVWHDRRDPEALYLIKHQNPLNLVVVPRIKTLFWSSEFGHLSAVMQALYGKSNVDWFPLSFDADAVFRVSWAPGANRPTLKGVKVEFPKPKAIRYPPVGNYGGATNWQEYAAKMGWERDDEASQSARFDAIVDTCGVCNAVIHEEDVGYMYYPKSDLTLCATCREWWQKNGRHTFKGDLVRATEVMDARGDFASNAVERGKK